MNIFSTCSRNYLIVDISGSRKCQNLQASKLHISGYFWNQKLKKFYKQISVSRNYTVKIRDSSNKGYNGLSANYIPTKLMNYDENQIVNKFHWNLTISVEIK